MGLLETLLKNKDTLCLTPCMTVNFVLYIFNSWTPNGTIEAPANTTTSDNV